MGFGLFHGVAAIEYGGLEERFKGKAAGALMVEFNFDFHDFTSIEKPPFAGGRCLLVFLGYLSDNHEREQDQGGDNG